MSATDEDDEDRNDTTDIHLEWRDYVAIVIAMFETVLVPVLVVMVILVLIVVLLLL